MRYKRLISAIVFCLYIAAIAYICFAKPEDMPAIPETWFGLPADKVGHFLMFLPFPILGFTAVCSRQDSMRKKFLTLTALIATGAAAAVGIEIVQAHLQYRSFETQDIFADGLGLICGGILTSSYLMISRGK
jgi:VanZ family protein